MTFLISPSLTRNYLSSGTENKKIVCDRKNISVFGLSYMLERMRPPASTGSGRSETGEAEVALAAGGVGGRGLERTG